MEKSKRSFLINLFLIIFFFEITCCTSTVEKVKYDRDIIKFKFYLPLKKVSLGLVYFTDSRTDFDRLGEDLVGKKKSIREFSTKLAQELLTQNNTFSSITFIQPIELPDFSNEQEIQKFLKNKDIDYIFLGDIVLAKVVKVERKKSIKKDLTELLYFGNIGEDFVYVGKAKVRGKLYSISERKVVWQGEGQSNFLPNSKYATTEILLIGALHNAIGYMLKDMTAIFNLKVKEIE